ncbi:MAG: NAD+ synthase [Bacteroidota bacterium]
MNIALAQLNYHVGDFQGNTSRIIAAIEKAKRLKADVVVFAELSVCGYPPRDFLEFDDFIRQSIQSVQTIASVCRGIAAVVGAPSVNLAPRGKPLYNTAFFLAYGAIYGMAHKTLLPNYDVFDEYRYFEPNRLPFKLVEYLGCRFALTICEDLWNVADAPLYVRNPMDELVTLNPDLVINIAASPFNYNQRVTRREVLSRNAITYHCPIFYLNQVGGQTELIFDGDSMVVSPDGEIISGLKCFEEDFQVFDLSRVGDQKSVIRNKNARKKDLLSPITYPLSSSVNLGAQASVVRSALVLGIRDYFRKMGFSSAILGLSGGIDSAVTLVLAVEALGPENVRAILLPSEFSSEHSITDALDLVQNLGVSYEIIPIGEGFKTMQHILSPLFGDLPFNLTEENIQARLRALILMALSNKFGHILLNTSNKSEAAVGYGTLYGDMCGGLSVLGDVYKTQVYELARLINSQRTIIPENSINKPPSAELRPGQKDSDSLPGYDILDRILYEYIEQRKGPEDLIREGFDESTVRRVLKLVNTSEYKRYQTPPILRVSPKAFGMGRRMPIVARYLS